MVATEFKANWKTLLLSIVVSLLLMVGILHFVSAEKFFAEFSNINYLLLLVSVIFLLIMYVGMTYRIKIVLDAMQVNLKFIDMLKSHFVGMLLADFTPARSGYFATAAVLHYNYKAPPDKAMVSIFGPQIFDFALKAVAGTAAVIILLWKVTDEHNKPFLLVGSVVMSLGVATMLLLLFSERFLRLFTFSKKLPLVGGIYQLLESMQKNSHIIVKKTPELLVLLLFTWSAKAISWYFVGKALGITIDIGIPELAFYYLFQPLVTMLEFIPLPTLAGTGASEAGSAFIFAALGMNPATGAAFAFLARIKTTVVNMVAVPETLRMLPQLVKKT
ncbi:MAG: lysylphosphatidylglycerol synthase transmembrane domain-containing protein [Candidatus Micrarchaeota archaeon]|nr:lysylphosphatidylglycerol synthase transmembrane domain-containing protein [Candidatus Micrarchaeota archaeon]